MENVAAFDGMGTTVVVATCFGKYLKVANVGDSRLYIINDRITQITKDRLYQFLRLFNNIPLTVQNHTDFFILQHICQSSIVNVYDVGEENGIYYIVMELVEGITLKKYIEKKARLSVKEAVSIAIHLLVAVAAPCLLRRRIMYAPHHIGGNGIAGRRLGKGVRSGRGGQH